jgi:hypothetical protein
LAFRGNTRDLDRRESRPGGKMIRRLLSLGITVSLVCCLCALSVFGKTGSESTETLKPTSAPVKSEAKANQKLKADVLKLTADAKAGKIVPRSPSPFQPAQRNNMSTGAKIAIVAIIAGTVFLIFAVHAINSD